MDQFGFPNKQVEYSEAQTLVLKTLTSNGGSYVNWDLGTEQNAEVTLTSNVTMNNPTGWKAGRMAMIEIIQDSTGGRTVGWSSNFVNVSTLTLQTTAGYSNILVFKCVLINGLQKVQLMSNNASTRA